MLPKSRYDCIDLYLSPAGVKYNDQEVLYEQEHLDLLLQAGKNLPYIYFLLCFCLHFVVLHGRSFMVLE